MSENNKQTTCGVTRSGDAPYKNVVEMVSTEINNPVSLTRLATNFSRKQRKPTRADNQLRDNSISEMDRKDSSIVPYVEPPPVLSLEPTDAAVALGVRKKVRKYNAPLIELNGDGSFSFPSNQFHSGKAQKASLLNSTNMMCDTPIKLEFVNEHELNTLDYENIGTEIPLEEGNNLQDCLHRLANISTIGKNQFIEFMGQKFNSTTLVWVESSALLFLSLYDSATWRGILAAIAQFVGRITKSTIVDNVSEVSKYLIGCLGLTRTSGIADTAICHSDSAPSIPEEVTNFIRGVSRRASFVKDSKILKNCYSFLAGIVTLGICNADSLNFSIGSFDIIKSSIVSDLVRKSGTMNILTGFFDIASSILEKFWFAFINLDIRYLFHADYDMQCLEEKFFKIQNTVDSLIGGTATREMVARDPKLLMDDIDNLISAYNGNSFHDRHLRTWSTQTFVLTKRLNDLEILKIDLRTFINSRKLREAPFVVVLYGAPGCGKSTMIMPIIKHFYRTRNEEIKSTDIATVNSDDKWEQCLAATTKCIILDDFASSCVGQGADASVQKLIRYCNNVPYAALHPVAESKGKVWIMPSLVMVTTNNPTLNCHIELNCPAAGLRRIHMMTFVTIKKEWESAKGVIDTAKVNKASRDSDCLLAVNTFSIKGTRVDPQNFSNMPAWQKLIVTIAGRTFECENLDLTVYLEVMRVMATQHAVDQRELIRRAECTDYVVCGRELYDRSGPCQQVASQCLLCRPPGYGTLANERLSGYLPVHLDEVAIESTAQEGFTGYYIVTTLCAIITYCYMFYAPMVRRWTTNLQSRILLTHLCSTERQEVSWTNTRLFFKNPFVIKTLLVYKVMYDSMFSGRLSMCLNCIASSLLLAGYHTGSVEFYAVSIVLMCSTYMLRPLDNFVSRRSNLFLRHLIYGQELGLIREAEAGPQNVAIHRHRCMLYTHFRKKFPNMGIYAGLLSIISTLVLAHKYYKHLASRALPHSALNPSDDRELEDAIINTTNIIHKPDAAQHIPREKNAKGNCSAGEQFVDTMKKYMCYCSYPTGTSNMTVNALIVCTHHYLFPAHFIIGALKDNKHTITIKRSHAQTVATYDIKLDTTVQNWFIDTDHDVCVVFSKCGGPTKTMIPYFMGDDVETANINRGTMRMLYASRVDQSVLFGEFTGRQTARYESSNVHFNISTIGYKLTYAKTFSGMCGSIVFDPENRIYGFHVAKRRTVEDIGMCNVLSRSTLNDLVDKTLLLRHGWPVVDADPQQGIIPLFTNLSLPKVIEKLEIHERSTAYDFYKEEKDHTMAFVGSCMSFAKPTHSFVPSPISSNVTRIFSKDKLLGPNLWQLPYTGARDHHNYHNKREINQPYLIGMNKYDSPAKEFPGDILERAYQDFLRPIKTKFVEFTKMKYDSDCRNVAPLTEYEVLNGVENERSIDSLPLTTAMGPGFIGPKNRYVESICNDSEDYNTTMRNMKFTDEVLEHVRAEEDTMRKLIIPVSFRKASLKANELQPLDKKKCRIFFGQGIATCCLIRKYFCPIIQFINCYPLLNECAVGINPTSPQWDEMWVHVTKYQRSDGPSHMFGGDYKSYDAKLNAQLLLSAFRFFIDLAKTCDAYTEEDINVMMVLAHDVVYPIVMWNGSGFQCTCGGHVSGNNLTVYLNSISNALIQRMCFYKHNPNFSDFRLFVNVTTYGDDVVGSVSHYDKLVFNVKIYAAFCAEYGMSFTLPDKGEVVDLWLANKDVTFLKRTSNYIAVIQTWVGALSESSISKHLHWHNVDAQITTAEHIRESIRSAMLEWFYHGKYVYDNRRKKMRDLVAELKKEDVFRDGEPYISSQISDYVDLTFEERLEAWAIANKYVRNPLFIPRDKRHECQTDAYSKVMYVDPEAIDIKRPWTDLYNNENA